MLRRVLVVFCLPLILFGATRRAPIVPIAAPQWIVRAAAAAPPIAELQRVVLQQATLAGESPTRWARDVRRAAWLPRLQLGVRKNMQQHYALRLDDTASVTSSGVVIGPRTSNFSDVGDDRVQLDIRLQWSLNELLFSADTLAVHREARAVLAERRAVLEQAHRAYTAWVQATAVLLDVQRPRDADGTSLAHLQQLQAQVTLDGLSDGWFSNALADDKQR